MIEHHNNITGANFMITSTKLYVQVATFSNNGSTNFLETIKQGFKRTIPWNKFRSEITTQTKSIKLDYLADAAFRNINRLFELSFKTRNLWQENGTLSMINQMQTSLNFVITTLLEINRRFGCINWWSY